MKTLSEKAQAFLARKPTCIGSHCGHDYYEHPDFGDESTLICITANGKKKTSDFWDMESVYQYGDEFPLQ